MNSINILGRLTADPEIQTVKGKDKSKYKVCRFTVAVRRTEDITDFIPCSAWEKTAEMLEKFFHKGQRIAVSGRLEANNYEDDDGNKRTSFTVRANSVDFCESIDK